MSGQSVQRKKKPQGIDSRRRGNERTKKSFHGIIPATAGIQEAKVIGWTWHFILPIKGIPTKCILTRNNHLSHLSRTDHPPPALVHQSLHNGAAYSRID